MNFFTNIFRKQEESRIVAAKLGIIVICKYCHEEIHLEDAENYSSGNLDEEDGYNVWVHKNKKTYCKPNKHVLAYPMKVDI